MASIDKIYISSIDEWREFYDWCKHHDANCKKEFNTILTSGFYSHDENYVAEWLENMEDIPCTSMSQTQDVYLIKYCDIPFVSKRLQAQYNETYNEIKKGNHKPLYINYPQVSKFKFIDESTNCRFGNYAGTVRTAKGKKNNVLSGYNIYVRGAGWRWCKQSNRWANIYNELDAYNYYNDYPNTMQSLRAVKRVIRTFKLPKGTEIIIRGPYVGQNYTIIVK